MTLVRKGQQSMQKIEIIPVKYGASVLPEHMIFEHGDKDKVRPIIFRIFLLRAGERLILVDAGCETMPGFEMTEFIGPIRALEKLQLTPEQITDVVITHAHHDHIESVTYFKNADIYIQKDEYESGRNYLAPDLKVRTFEEEIEIYPNIRCIRIGGHSKGSCIVEIKSEGKTYVITGDECYQRECLEKKIPTGTSCCPQKSREFVEKYGNSSCIMLLCHEE